MHPGGRWSETCLLSCRRAVPARIAISLLRAGLGAGLAAGLAAGLLAGCGGPTHQTGTAAKVTPCGSSRTAANVPIHIEVAKGHVGCGVALAIEKQYARAIRSGRAPGNGGGGPVKVNGWTCQGYSTPVVLHTGKASRCTQGTSEILAILPSTS